jgi:thymidylate kinase
MRSVVVALTGPSGAGKSTVVRTLTEDPGWTALDEAFYRLRPRPSLRFRSQRELLALERRLLTEEGRRFREARELARQGRTVIADTAFLDPATYTAGLLILGLASPGTFAATIGAAEREVRAGRLGVPDLTVRLSVPPATRRRRTELDPQGHPRAFRARHEAVGRVEAERLVPALVAALPGRVRVVRADRPAEEVAARVRALVARARPLRDPVAAARRALDALVRLPALRAASRASGNLKRRTLPPRPPR